MVWTANLIYKKPNLEGGNIELKIEFTNGNLSFTEVFFIKSLDFDGFKNQIRRRLNELNNIQELYTSISPGSLDVSKPPAASLSTEEQNFIDDLTLLNRLINGVNLGIVGSDNSYLINAKTRVASGLNANLSWNKYL